MSMSECANIPTHINPETSMFVPRAPVSPQEDPIIEFPDKTACLASLIGSVASYQARCDDTVYHMISVNDRQSRKICAFYCIYEETATRIRAEILSAWRERRDVRNVVKIEETMPDGRALWRVVDAV